MQHKIITIEEARQLLKPRGRFKHVSHTTPNFEEIDSLMKQEHQTTLRKILKFKNLVENK